MDRRQDEREETWADLIPVQPQRRDRWLPWLVGGGAGAAVLCLCAVLIFFIAREFGGEATAVVEAPTVPATADAGSVATSTTAPATTELEPTASPEPTQAPAPTATIAPTATSEEGAMTTPDLEATRLETPPLIDGQLTDWPALPSYSSAFTVFNAPSWDGTEDLQARWQLGWDAIHLYVAVEVRDDTHVQTQSGNQLFRGDSVDIQFDTNRPGDLGPQLSPDDYQITLSPGDFSALPPSAFRFRGTTAGTIVDAPGHGVSVAAQPNPDGYTLEAAIPWADLGLSPTAGLTIGLALNANDNDTPGTAVQEVMMSHIATRTLTDPTSWGTLTLR